MDACSICCEMPQLPYTLKCSHTFCFICIKGWLSKGDSNGTCPVCRAPAVNQLDRTRIPKSLVQHPSKWYYAGGKVDEWWAFDPVTEKTIERAYQRYLMVRDRKEWYTD